MHTIVKPPALKRGDTIKIIAPSTAISDESGLLDAISFIKKQGFEVNLSTSLTHESPNRFLSVGDHFRTQEIENAFKSDNIKAIMCLRGGSGAIDLLNMINYDVIKDNPKIFIGSSDVTFLQLAFLKKANLVTFHGPMLIDLMEKNRKVLNYNWSVLQKIIMDGEMLELKNPTFSRWSRTVIDGKVSGTLVGGNLSAVSLIANTDFMPDLEESILFLEDVDIEPWMLDNLLTSLVLKGVLQKAKGIFFGEFPYHGLAEMLKMQTAPSVFFKNMLVEDYINAVLHDQIIDILTKKIAKKPSFTEFSCCHGKYILTLPIGLNVELNADEQSIKMLEKAVS
jgi:muramoyltetrapeptide carboxypeptidase